MTSPLRLCRSLLGACLLMAGQLYSQISTPPEALPSFKTDQLFDTSGVESVSLFSGDVQLAVPIGPKYDLGPGISWQLRAHYSTRLWNVYNGSPCGTTECQVTHFNRHAVLAGTSTLGPGWTLTPGYVTSESADGDHGFRFRSSDGSVQALTPLGNAYRPSGDDAARFVRTAYGWRLDASDGTRWFFESAFSPPSRPNGFDFYDGPYLYPTTPTHWGLSRVEDRFRRTVLDVTYVGGDPWRVAAISIGGRIIQFHWTLVTTAAIYPEPARSWNVLSAVDFPTSHGGQLSAEFTFEDRAINRSGFEEGDPFQCSDPSGPSRFRVPYLVGIQEAGRKYTFTYDNTAPYVTTGVIRSLRIPSGALISYEFDDVGLQAGPCPRGTNNCTGPVEDLDPPRSGSAVVKNLDPECNFADYQHYVDASPAVSKRTEVDPVTSLTSVTEYRRANYYETEGPNQPEANYNKVIRVAVVERPDGNGDRIATKYFFSVGADGRPNSGIEFARRYYDGIVVAGVAPVRSVVYCHDANTSGGAAVVCGPTEADGRIAEVSTADFQRLRREVTWYGSSPTTGGACTSAGTPCRQIAFEDYDPTAREYRTRTLTSSYSGGPFFQSRTWSTTYASYLEGDYWLPKRVASESVTDAGCPGPCDVVTSYEYLDASRPAFLTKTSRSDPRSDYPSTVTRSYVADSYGNPGTERLLGTGAVEGEFTTTRSFLPTGLLTTSQRTGTGFKTFDVDRDPSSGLATSSRDPNLLVTTYTYDELGRLSKIAPPGLWPSWYCFQEFDPATNRGAYVVLRSAASSPGCAVLDDGVPVNGSGALEAYQYDGLGRLIRQIRRLPNALSPTNSYLAVQRTRYNDAGYVSFESEWTPCAGGQTDVAGCFTTDPVSGTTYSTFDPFGRPLRMELADHKIRTTSYASGTVAHSDWSEAVTVQDVGGVPSTTIRLRDALGRFWKVVEPDVDPLHPETTVYGWNVLDKLAGSLQPLQDGDGNLFSGQLRQYDWDRHGFLRNELHPEIRDAVDPSQRGLRFFPRYTALGTPLEERVLRAGPGGTDRVTAYAYDAAGRTLARTVDGTLYSEYSWDGAGYSGPNTLGRLTRRIGYNPLGSPSGAVTEYFRYDGVGGRLGYKRTMLTAPQVDVEQSWDYNTLGSTDSYGHPRLRGSGTSLKERFTYRSGHLVSIGVTENGGTQQDVVSAIGYAPSGGVASYTTANGATTTSSADPFGMARPGRILTTVFGQTRFDTGAYVYDGAGNITAIGGDSFGYDRLSRLTTAATRALDGVTMKRDELGYDRFGNINYWERDDTWVQSPNPDPSTNRLVGSQIQYDPDGNLIRYGGEFYAYDRLGRQTSAMGSSVNEQYLYDGADERVVRIGAYTSALAIVTPPGLTGEINEAFSYTFTSMGGTPPLRWTIASGSALPSGLTLNAATGVLSGTPTVSGQYVFVLVLSDAFGSQQKSVTLNIAGHYLFFPITPCRLFDTRLGPPAIASGGQRDFFARGACGVATNAQAIAANVVSIIGPADGMLTAFATGLTPPLANTVAVKQNYVWAARTDIQLNAQTGGFSLRAELACTQCAVDALVDVFGYYARSDGQLARGEALSEGLPAARWSSLTPVAAGGSAFVTTRDEQQRLTTEFLQVNQQGNLNVLKDYVYLGRQKIATLERLQSFSGWKYYASDHLGSTRLEMDGSGEVTARYKYRAFGEVLPDSAAPPKLGFAAMELDAAAGNHYDHARYFRGMIGVGRFNSPDELLGSAEDPQSWNRYTYARNNPLKYVDGNGKQAAEAATWGRMLTILPTVGVSCAPPPLLVAGALATLGGFALGRGIGEYVGNSPSFIPVRTAAGIARATGQKTELGPIHTLETRGQAPPQKALDVLAEIDKTGQAPSGYKGGDRFQNDGRRGGEILPQTDSSGNPITYNEWDVNPFTPGQNRGEERLVTGSNGKVYWTTDHYKTFEEIR